MRVATSPNSRSDEPPAVGESSLSPCSWRRLDLGAAVYAVAPFLRRPLDRRDRFRAARRRGRGRGSGSLLRLTASESGEPPLSAERSPPGARARALLRARFAAARALGWVVVQRPQGMVPWPRAAPHEAGARLEAPGRDRRDHRHRRGSGRGARRPGRRRLDCRAGSRADLGDPRGAALVVAAALAAGAPRRTRVSAKTVDHLRSLCSGVSRGSSRGPARRNRSTAGAWMPTLRRKPRGARHGRSATAWAPQMDASAGPAPWRSGARGARPRARSRGPCARRCSRRPRAGRRWARCPLRA